MDDGYGGWAGEGGKVVRRIHGQAWGRVHEFLDVTEEETNWGHQEIDVRTFLVILYAGLSKIN